MKTLLEYLNGSSLNIDDMIKDALPAVTKLANVYANNNNVNFSDVFSYLEEELLKIAKTYINNYKNKEKKEKWSYYVYMLLPKTLTGFNKHSKNRSDSYITKYNDDDKIYNGDFDKLAEIVKKTLKEKFTDKEINVFLNSKNFNSGNYKNDKELATEYGCGVSNITMIKKKIIKYLISLADDSEFKTMLKHMNESYAFNLNLDYMCE